MIDTVYFKHDFENNSLGNYDQSECHDDWRPSYLETAISGGKFENIKILSCMDCERQTKVSRWILNKEDYGPFTGGGKWNTALTDNSYFTKLNEVYLTFRIKHDVRYICEYKIKLPGLSGPDWDSGPEGESFFCVQLFCNQNYLYFKIKDQNNELPRFIKWNFDFMPGTWYTITIRMVLNNDPDQDGIAEGFVNGQLKCQVKNLRFRKNNTIRIHALLMHVYSCDPLNISTEVNSERWVEMDDIIVYDYDPAFKKEKGIAIGNSCMNSDPGFRLPPPRLKERIDPVVG